MSHDFGEMITSDSCLLWPDKPKHFVTHPFVDSMCERITSPLPTCHRSELTSSFVTVAHRQLIIEIRVIFANVLQDHESKKKAAVTPYILCASYFFDDKSRIV